MKNPTSRQFKRVINNLIKALPLAEFEGHLDMSQGTLPESKDSIYETPMCFGGWYAVINGIYDDYDDGSFYDYDDGAVLVAKHLGFDGKYELENWAADNVYYWGNWYGDVMFTIVDAFGADDRSMTLKRIIDHFIGVHNRTCPKSQPILLLD